MRAVDSWGAVLKSVVEAGVLAPSADNHHRFCVRPTDTGLELFADATYREAPFHQQVLARVSFGAVVENMVVRAAQLGYRTEVDWLPEPAPSWLMARLRLHPTGVADDSLSDALRTRQTNRTLRYAGPRLPDQEVTTLVQSVASLEGIAVRFFDRGPLRKRLLGMMALAEAERFRLEPLHAELFGAVRFDVGWQESADQGLPPGALGVEPGARWLFAQLRHWPVMKRLAGIGGHRLLGLRSAGLPARLAPHLGVITTTLPLDRGALLAGAALERIWLAAEVRRLAFQPFAGAALLALRDYRDVSESTRRALQAGWKTLTSGTPLMLFRLGRARRPPVRTSRPPPDQFVCPEANIGA